MCGGVPDGAAGLPERFRTSVAGRRRRGSFQVGKCGVRSWGDHRRGWVHTSRFPRPDPAPSWGWVSRVAAGHRAATLSALDAGTAARRLIKDEGAGSPTVMRRSGPLVTVVLSHATTVWTPLDAGGLRATSLLNRILDAGAAPLPQGRVKIAACTELVTLSGELWNNCGA
jgi:hypothetical protein